MPDEIVPDIEPWDDIKASFLNRLGAASERAQKVVHDQRTGMDLSVGGARMPQREERFALLQLVTDVVPAYLNEAAGNNESDAGNAQLLVWSDDNQDWVLDDGNLVVVACLDRPLGQGERLLCRWHADRDAWVPAGSRQVAVVRILTGLPDSNQLLEAYRQDFDSNTAALSDAEPCWGFNAGDPGGTMTAGSYPSVLVGHFAGRLVWSLVGAGSGGGPVDDPDDWDEKDGTDTDDWPDPAAEDRPSVWRMPPGTLTGMEAPYAALTSSGNLYNGAPYITDIPGTSGFAVGDRVAIAGFPSATLITSIDSASQVTVSHPATTGGFSLQTTGNTTNGGTAVTSLASTAGVSAGYQVIGSGIPLGATVVSVDSSTQVTLSAAATATATGVTIWFLGDGTNTALTIHHYAGGKIYPVVLWAESGDLVLTHEDPHSIAIDRFHLKDGYTNTQAGNAYLGAPFLTNLSSTAVFHPGDPIVCSAFPAGTTVVSVDTATRITLSNNATSGAFALNTTGDTHNGTAILDGLASTTGVAGGYKVIADGVPDGTTVVSVDSPTQVTLSNNSTLDGTGVSVWFLGGSDAVNVTVYSEHVIKQDGWAWCLYDSSIHRYRAMIFGDPTDTTGSYSIQVEQINPTLGPYVANLLQMDRSTGLEVVKIDSKTVEVKIDPSKLSISLKNEFEGSTYVATAPVQLNDSTGITGWELAIVDGPLTDIRLLGASPTQMGAVTTAGQNFGGTKGFDNGLIATGDADPTGLKAAIISTPSGATGTRAAWLGGDVHFAPYTSPSTGVTMDIAGNDWTASTNVQATFTFTNFTLILTGAGTIGGGGANPLGGALLIGPGLPGATPIGTWFTNLSTLIKCSTGPAGSGFPIFEVYNTGGNAVLVLLQGGSAANGGWKLVDGTADPDTTLHGLNFDAGLGCIAATVYAAWDSAGGAFVAGASGAIQIGDRFAGGIYLGGGTGGTPISGIDIGGVKISTMGTVTDSQGVSSPNTLSSFTTSQTPLFLDPPTDSQPYSMTVTWNDVALTLGTDYTVSGTTITFSPALQASGPYTNQLKVTYTVGS